MSAATGGAWPERWRARWIWFELPDLEAAFTRGEPPTRPPDGFGYLRRRFTLARAASGRGRVTADGRYVLFLDGVEVARGPVRSYPWSWTFDPFVLDLPAGEHVLAALVRGYGGPTNASVPAQPVGALGFGSFLLEAEIGDETIVTDETWRAREAPYARARHHEGPPPPEVVDGSAIPAGWTQAAFDDSFWGAAVVVDPSGPGIRDPHPPTDPFPRIAPRPIPPLRERVVACLPTGDLFDAGGIVNAHPILALDADAGTEVELTVGEALDDAGEPVLDVRRWHLRYTAAGRPGETIETFEPIGFRFARARVLRGAARSIEVRARERLFPRDDGASFRCSDETLNRIWEVGLRTLDACSTDAFLDCPGREQRAWLGDAYGHAIVSLLVNPDTSLVRWMLRLHAAGARADGLLPMVAAGDFSQRASTIPDFSLLWILALAHVHRWTGDDALAAELLPTAVCALSWFEQRRGGDGLLRDVPGWVFIDWAQLQRGRTFAPLDALYAMALDAAATIADEPVAADLGARADHTRAAFEAYWDQSRGIYVDTIGGRRISQHTNALAILSGAATRARWDPMLAHVLSRARVRRTRTPGDPGSFDERIGSQYLEPEGFDDEVNVVEAQPFFSHFLHQAVAHAGRYDLLLDLIRRWGPMCEPGTFGEYWDNRPGLASFCHAWAAVPLYDLATHILGVRCDGGELSVEPHLGDLARAEGSVATKDGWLRIAARADGSVDVAEDRAETSL